jgi:hypothetical protein
MYESCWIYHRWDFLGYIRGVYLYFSVLFLFLSFFTQRLLYLHCLLFYNIILLSFTREDHHFAAPCPVDPYQR